MARKLGLSDLVIGLTIVAIATSAPEFAVTVSAAIRDQSEISVGNIVEKPVVKDGQIVVGNTMKLSLACDHRTVDGATGAQFLQTLKGYIENPVTMLV